MASPPPHQDLPAPLGPYERSSASRLHLRVAPPDPDRVRFLELKRVTVRGDFAFPSHRHATYELFIPQRGDYVCAVNGVRHRLRHGEAILIQPGDVHSDHYLPGASFLIALLEPAHPGGGEIIGPDAPATTRLVRLASQPRLAALGEALAAGAAPRQEALPTLEPLTLAFFWELVAALPQEALAPVFLAGRQGSSFRALATGLLSATPARDFDAGALAARLGLSRRAMELRFRRFLGRPPEQALLALKVEEAVRLLADGFTVQATAEALGFANQFHFSRVFKRFSGHSPALHPALRDMR